MSTDVTSEPAYTRETDNCCGAIAGFCCRWSCCWLRVCRRSGRARRLGSRWSTWRMAYHVFVANLPQGSPLHALWDALAVRSWTGDKGCFTWGLCWASC